MFKEVRHEMSWEELWYEFVKDIREMRRANMITREAEEALIQLAEFYLEKAWEKGYDQGYEDAMPEAEE